MAFSKVGLFPFVYAVLLSPPSLPPAPTSRHPGPDCTLLKIMQSEVIYKIPLETLSNPSSAIIGYVTLGTIYTFLGSFLSFHYIEAL